MGRTIGRFIPPGTPHRTFESRCDICGVAWPRHRLREDGAGRLVCPDEGSGLDEVTLGELNARAIARLEQPYLRMGGSPRGPDTDFYQTPTSILGLEASTGWWPWDQGLKTTPNQVNWTNQVIAAGQRGVGELVAYGDDIPTIGATGLVFAGGPPLLANKGPFIRIGEEQVDIWMVADLDEEVETYQEMLAVRAVASDGATLAGVALGRWRSDVSSGQVWGLAKFAEADPGFYFSAPRPADGVHIYKASVTPELCTLTIDDDAYTAAPVFAGGFAVPCNHLRMGYQAYGTYSEAAVSI